ncbi:hypothetical protein SAMN05216249_101151 [Acetitomaculum ruminis DSM 5522]|uniref:Uncharacterized protein n=1 Tax=Acetitomaculum ruminis DSM 5522 TaxID=1120918 RepID=A0A1I0V487_9FIRM|nr:hypothetical protein [Acetitomaculum ruminis]SFA71091.1 hypothetical protein SAMN05216249_101151 [Acetitomaculum ruminis DSM 5522]
MEAEKTFYLKWRFYIAGIYLLNIMLAFFISYNRSTGIVKGIIIAGFILIVTSCILIFAISDSNEKYYIDERLVKIRIIFAVDVFTVLCLCIFIYFRPFLAPLAIIGIAYTAVINVNCGVLINLLVLGFYYVLTGFDNIYLFFYILSAVVCCTLINTFKSAGEWVMSLSGIVLTHFSIIFLINVYNEDDVFKNVGEYLIFNLFIILAFEFLAVFFVQKYDEIYLNRYYERILSPKSEILEKFRDLYGYEYEMCVKAGDFGEKVAKKFNLDVRFCKAVGYYSRIGILEGETNLAENNVKVARSHKIGEKLTEAIFQVADGEYSPETMEGAVILLANSCIDEMKNSETKFGKMSMSREIVIQQVFNKVLSKGLLDNCNMSMPTYLALKEYFANESELL